MTIEGLESPNKAPVITALTDTTIVAGQPFTRQVYASDADGDSLIFSLDNLWDRPISMEIDSSTGLISYSHVSYLDLGQNSVRVIVSDGQSTVFSNTFTLTIIADSTNTGPPEFLSLTDTVAVVGQPFTRQIHAWDPDGDELTYSVLYEWPSPIQYYIISVDSLTGIISVTPQESHIGDSTIRLQLYDRRGGVVDSTFVVSVIEQEPDSITILTTSLKDAVVGEFYSDTVYAVGYENVDSIGFNLTTKPEWLSMYRIDSLGILQGTPSSEHAGTNIPITLSVLDSSTGSSDSLATAINVLSDNQPPQIVTTSLPDAYEGQLYSHTVEATDPDMGDVLTYELTSQSINKVAFISNRDGDFEIYVMDADGSNQIRLTNSPLDDADPTWSPDGSKIVFSSFREGDAAIYVMDADGSNQTRLTNNPADEHSPVWSPGIINPSWLSINISGELSGTPGTEDVGIDIPVSIKVTDSGGLTDSLVTTIDVIADSINSIPVITALTDTTIIAGQPFTRQVYALDADGDSLEYSLTFNGGSLWSMVIDSLTGLISYSHVTYGDFGLNYVSVRVSDGQSSVASNIFTLTIIADSTNNRTTGVCILD